MNEKKASDYTGLGENYRKYRQGYSEKVLDGLLSHVGLNREGKVVDVGAGTGIWVEQIARRGYNCIAIEPNDDMRKNGQIYTGTLGNVEWRKGTGEQTGLSNDCADWVTMASAFHWTDPNISLPEFHRILREEGYITLLWNPLWKEGDPTQEAIERIIQKNVPDFSRSFRNGENSSNLILGSNLFKEVFEIRAIDYKIVPRDNYLMAWRAANHLKTEADKKGPNTFDTIIHEMEELLSDTETVKVPYLTKSWTAKKIKR